MAKKTTALVAPKTRKVRVHESTRRQYVEDEPVEEIITTEEPEEIESDPISDFFTELDETRTLRMFVWALPTYHQNRKTGRRAPDSIYVTDFPFSATETETYRSHIQGWYPQGGMFYLELRDGSRPIKTWSEQIAGIPGYKGEQQPRAGYALPYPQPQPINITVPNGAQQQQQANPVDMIREQFGVMREVVSIMKEISPAPPVVNVGGNGEVQKQDQHSLQDRLLETVIVKALESDKAPIDKVLDALSGRREREPGWFDSFAPVLAELAKGLAPAINMGIQAYVRSQIVKPQQVAVSEVPQEQEAQAQIAGPVDPAERAWRRLIQRMLEDCFEHVQVAAVSSDGVSIQPAVSQIVELVDRFQNNEQLVAMVQALLDMPGEQVIDMCALLQTTERDSQIVQTLKQAPAALAWLAELQSETKKILSEGEDANTSGD